MKCSVLPILRTGAKKAHACALLHHRSARKFLAGEASRYEPFSSRARVHLSDNGARMTFGINALPRQCASGPAVFASACLLLAAACSHTPPPRSEPSQLLERVMPMFSSTSLNGTSIETGGIDAPLVVKFFDADCTACSRTLPAAQRVYAQMPNVVVIGVSEDAAEAQARQAVNKYGLRFPVVIDRDNSIARSFKIKDTPMTFVADRQGRIRWVGGENVTEAVLLAAVESVDD